MAAIKIIQRGSQPPTKAPERNFTGEVHIGDYFSRPAPSRLVTATVTFAPGARTPWKVNPLGQTLVVTDGVGWAQCEGEETVEIRAGDLVWCPPGVPHWDGATPEQGLTYIAIHETKDGVGVSFYERVTDEEYSKGPSQ